MTSTETRLKDYFIAGFFLLLVLFYFVPFGPAFKIAFPLLLLALCSPGRLPWQMCLAFAFSCAGDLAGSFTAEKGQVALLVQMGSFALAHVFFIVFFLDWGWKEKKAAEETLRKASKNKKKQSTRQQGMYMAAVLVLTMMLIYNALTLIVPNVQDGVMRNAVTGYVILVSIMMWSALMNRDWIWGLGAVLFVVSDFILAWQMFVERISGAGYLIMIPYFAAQAILFFRTSKKNGVAAK